MGRTGALRQRLYQLSRDRRCLLRLGVVILGFAFLLALSTSSFRNSLRVEMEPRSPLITLELALTRERATPESIADQLRNLHELIPAAGDYASQENRSFMLPEGLNLTTLEDFLAHSPLDPSQRQLFVAYLNARYSDDDQRETAYRYLETHARMRPAVRFANEFVGDLLFADDKFEESISRFEVEATDLDSAYARERIISTLLLTGDAEKLRAVTAREDFKGVPTRLQQTRIAILLKDWAGLLPAVIAYDFHATGAPERLLTLFAASVWLLIVIQLGRFAPARMLFYVLGILAGMLSGTATLYVLILQENVGDMSPGADWIEEVIYFVTGVALREEFLKLAFFALIIPAFWKRKDPLEALLVASCVGIGFGLQENVSYYRSSETVALTRFLTANFLHLAWTGLLGLALFQMLLSFKRNWEEFLATFIGVVLVHGLYDSFLGVPEFSDYAILSFVIIFVVAQRFFLKAAELRDAGKHVLSPLAVFLLGTTLLIGVVLNYAAWRSPLQSSLIEVGFAVLSVVPVAFVFINQFKED